MQVRLLGPLTVRDAGGDVVPLGGPKQRAVLAALVLHAGEVVSVGRLTDLVWEDDPPADPATGLASYVSRLRGVLGDGGSIEHRAGGYVLQLEGVTVDADEFDRMAQEGRDALANGSPDVGADGLRQALSLWRGEPLSDLGELKFAERERVKWESQRLEVLEDRIEAELAMGERGRLIPELEKLVREHPLREGFARQLMLALYRADRQADALDVYRQARGRLVEELGVEPGRSLQEMQDRILRQDPDLLSPAGPSQPRSGTGGATEAAGTAERPRNVPAPRTMLLGRSQELDDVDGLLERARLVTIIGPGGAGKTRLAMEIARDVDDRFDGGVAFADLTSVEDEGDVLGVVAGAVGVRLVGDRSGLRDALADRLSDGPALLLLDNCEHVVDVAATLTGQLLDDAGNLTVLATSRRPLDIDGEHLLPLGPLPLPDAEELFVQRADARRPGAGSDADDAAVRDLCRRLDRLPLAIELAAARVDHLAVDEITAELTGPLASDLPHLDVTERHSSLPAAIRWSYELLQDPTRAVLRRIAVFRGPFDRDQAAAIAADVASPQDTREALGDLTANSLLVAEPGRPTTYRMLDMIRRFAKSELEERGEAAAAVRRHRGWYVAQARDLPAGVSTIDAVHALSLNRHHPDLLAALASAEDDGEVEALADLAVFAGGLAFCPGGLPDADRWLRRACSYGDRLDEARRADLYGVATVAAILNDDRERTADLFGRASEIVASRPGGAGPIAVALAMSAPSIARRAAEVADVLLGATDGELRSDVRRAVAAHRTTAILFEVLSRTGAFDLQPVARVLQFGRAPRIAQTLIRPVVRRATRDAEDVWSERRWSDRDTLAGWTIHAGLLHITGRHDRLRDRLEAMERVPERVGPPTPFVTIFEALTRAAQGDTAGAIDHLRSGDVRHWLGIPGIDSDLLSTLAAIHVLDGKPDRARMVLDHTGFRSRHPGTGMVHVFYRQLLDVPIGPYLDWSGRDGRQLRGLLRDELGL